LRVELDRAVNISKPAFKLAIIDQELAINVMRQRDFGRELGGKFEQAVSKPPKAVTIPS
jgi:hypothetical protein